MAKPVTGRVGSASTTFRVEGDLQVVGPTKLGQDDDPASDEAGLFRYNPTSGKPEVSNADGGWDEIGSGGGGGFRGTADS
jgi:hypothetical protein